MKRTVSTYISKPKKFKKTFIPRPLRSEIKHFSINWLAVSVADSGTVTQLSNIAEGTTSHDRIGSKVMPLTLVWHFVLHNSTGAALDTYNQIRILFARNSTYDTTPTDFIADYSSEPKYDFTSVIKDKLIGTGSSQTSTGEGAVTYTHPTPSYEGKLRLSRKIMKYSTGSGSSQKENILWCIMMSDSSAINHPFISGYMTMFYTDA